MTSSTRRFVLGVDLDGVVADFHAGLRPIAAEWLGVAEDSLARDVGFGFDEWRLESIGTYEDLHRFAVTQRNLFRDMKPIRGAPATLRRLSARDIRIRIITHRLCIKYFHETSVVQTIEWLEHYGVPYWDLCFMKDKAAVGADLYIEDAPDNVRRLREDGHPTIVFTNSTNRGLSGPRANSWREVERLVLRAYAAWQRKSDAHSLSGL